MGIISFIIVAVILGLIVWAIRTYVPLPSIVQNIILAAVVIVLILLLLQATGVLNRDVAIPRIR